MKLVTLLIAFSAIVIVSAIPLSPSRDYTHSERRAISTLDQTPHKIHTFPRRFAFFDKFFKKKPFIDLNDLDAVIPEKTYLDRIWGVFGKLHWR
ncbi:hypothetical protein FRC03_009351 [Tulasnella sp. 419]|nr:hypothetical protein FRC02_002060 [Tulasnella sp. 418]KAG8958204.1 hypothetical protein FRC03_009351 [Tulasnella sp. 419]